MSSVLVAQHNAYSVFKVPKEYQSLPLSCFEIRGTTLSIWSEETPHKIICEVQASTDAEDTIDWKRPSTIFFDEKSNWPASEDEEENTDSQ